MLPLRSTPLASCGEAGRPPRRRAGASATPNGLLLDTGMVAIGSVEVNGSPIAPLVAAEQASRRVILFPRDLVRVHEEIGREWLGDATTTVLHSPGRRYSSGLGRPVRLDWFAVEAEVLRDLSLDHEASHESGSFCPAPTYLLQRLAFLALARDPASALAVEEVALRAVGQVLQSSRSMRQRAAKVDPESDDMVTRVRRAVADRYREELPLEELARAVGVSHFHLCRIFKRGAYLTVHRYLNELRLRAALDEVVASDRDLSAIALDYGFSSHSHFTVRFREAFAVTPSAFRRRAGAVNPLAGALAPAAAGHAAGQRRRNASGRRSASAESR